MNLTAIDRYILRTTLTSFAIVVVTLTGVIWITQALRAIDLMTSQGQTILTFLGITSMAIPVLVLIIAPIALMIAVSHTLTKLATDFEIIVMNAAGLSPIRLFMPFLYATVAVALLVAFIGFYLAPESVRRANSWSAEITADVLTNVLQPGRFAQLNQDLIIRIRERQPGGQILGIFIDDRRDPKERVSIIADHGTVVKNEQGSFLILEDGHLERFEVNKSAPALVAFRRYAFDMSTFTSHNKEVTYGIHERYIWELIWPPPTTRSLYIRRVSIAPSCMIVLPRRFMPSCSWPSPLHSSAALEPRDRAATSRRGVRFAGICGARGRLCLFGYGGELFSRHPGPVWHSREHARGKRMDHLQGSPDRAAGPGDRGCQRLTMQAARLVRRSAPA